MLSRLSRVLVVVVVERRLIIVFDLSAAARAEAGAGKAFTIRFSVNTPPPQFPDCFKFVLVFDLTIWSSWPQAIRPS